MEPIFKSDAFTLYHDPREFVEFVVNHGHELNLDDLLSLEPTLIHCRLPLRVLANRKHDYSTSASILIPPFPKLNVEIGKVAYVVYSSRTARIAEYVGNIALTHCPHLVFWDREKAIKWLLE